MATIIQAVKADERTKCDKVNIIPESTRSGKLKTAVSIFVINRNAFWVPFDVPRDSSVVAVA